MIYCLARRDEDFIIIAASHFLRGDEETNLELIESVPPFEAPDFPIAKAHFLRVIQRGNHVA